MTKKPRGSNAKEAKEAKHKELVTSLDKTSLAGEVITWSSKTEQQHRHKDIVAALMGAGLETKIARELLPRFAFSRAAKKLKESAVIDVVKDSENYVKFQFTKRTMKDDEWTYSKDTELTLNKTTGDITCPRKDLEKTAQKLLDEAMEIRTTSDISKIVQRLFDKNADLFPLRDQGGVYFVPVQFTEFTLKVHDFLEKLGGGIRRLPVPSGTQYGDKTIRDTVTDAMRAMLKEHLDAVGQFTLNTRKDTIQSAADKIKSTRVKIEAYANYLGEMKDMLLEEADTANQTLLDQIDKVTTERQNAPEGSGGLYGHSVTAVIRWMGKNGFNFKQCKEALDSHSLQIAEATIRAQLLAGRNGTRGEPAELSDKQIKQLRKFAA